MIASHVSTDVSWLLVHVCVAVMQPTASNSSLFFGAFCRVGAFVLAFCLLPGDALAVSQRVADLSLRLACAAVLQSCVGMYCRTVPSRLLLTVGHYKKRRQPANAAAAGWS